VRKNGNKDRFDCHERGKIEEIEKMINDYKKIKTDDKLPLPESVQRFTYDMISQGLERALEVLKKRVL